MLDRLRQDALDDDVYEEEVDTTDLVKEVTAEEDLIFGLTPAQRLVLSIFLFMDIAVVGFMLLVALGRINL